LTRSGRMFLRKAPVLAILCCLGAASAGSALAQSGPEPAPPTSQAPSPDPAPGVSSHTVSPPPAQPPAPPPPAQVQPLASAPTTAAKPERRPVRKREAAKKKVVAKQSSRQAANRVLSTLGGDDAGPRTALLIGGLGLLVLVLLDTVFLTLSTRTMRSAR
jgi:hypothetical protein